MESSPKIADKGKKNVSWLGDTAMAKATAISNVVIGTDTDKPSASMTTSNVPSKRPKSLFALRMEQSRQKAAAEAMPAKLTDPSPKVDEEKDAIVSQQLSPKKHVNPSSFGKFFFFLILL